MKIALVTETFPPQINGVSRTLEQLARHAVRRGDEIMVVHPKYASGERSSLAAESGRYRDLELPALPLPFYPEVILPRPPFGRMRRSLDAFRPDIVHIATEALLGYSALRHCLKRKWPVVSSFHTNFDTYAAHYRLGWTVPTLTRYLRGFHNRTAATYVPSRSMILKLAEQGFERLVLWSRGVDTAVFRPRQAERLAGRDRLEIPATAFVVGHCGRLAPEKNVEFLAEALERMLSRVMHAHAVIVGDGPSRAALENRLKSIPGLSRRVHFTGYLTGPRLADAYGLMDVFAFASRTETFGNVLLEAMATGLPVVALAEGGPADVVADGETGRLLSRDSKPSAMADILAEWSHLPATVRKLGESARAYAGTQSWEAIMEGLFVDYRRVIESRSKATSAN
ncbi:glycosyltransferase [bacterium]|nr:glycosyltransferase [bacterium]